MIYLMLTILIIIIALFNYKQKSTGHQNMVFGTFLFISPSHNSRQLIPLSHINNFYGSSSQLF